MSENRVRKACSVFLEDAVPMFQKDSNISLILRNFRCGLLLKSRGFHPAPSAVNRPFGLRFACVGERERSEKSKETR